MKKYSTISEISKLLGLSTDTIRFYEKKGLVHPHVNPENNYRMYTLMNVLELLDLSNGMLKNYFQATDRKRFLSSPDY